MSDVYCYLKYSSKRQQELGKLQTLLDIPEHKFVRLHKVRWLSLEAVVNRLLEQYPVLLKYFEEERVKVKKNDDAVKILDRLKNPFTRLSLEFLSFVLKLVCKRNREFQSEETLYKQMESLFKTIVGMYLKEEYLRGLYRYGIHRI